MPVKPIVLVVEPIADVGMQILGQSCEIIAPWKHGRPYSAEELAVAKGIIIRLTKVTAADTLTAAPKLKVIGRHGVGVDNVDLPGGDGKGNSRGLHTQRADHGRTRWLSKPYS